MALVSDTNVYIVHVGETNKVCIASRTCPTTWAWLIEAPVADGRFGSAGHKLVLIKEPDQVDASGVCVYKLPSSDKVDGFTWDLTKRLDG